MNLICPNCQAAIGGNDVNIATDLAKCAACQGVFGAVVYWQTGRRV